jgi:OTU domain-containing protein 6
MAKPKAKKYTPLPQPDPIDDDQLVDDLLAQLDSRNETVQEQSASVLNDMELDKRADAIDSAQKQDSNSRFRARKVSCLIFDRGGVG